MLGVIVFGTSEQFFVKTFWFQEKRRPKTYIVKFVETKQVSVFFLCWPVFMVTDSYLK